MNGYRIAVSSPEVFDWDAYLSGSSCMCVLVDTFNTAGGRVHLYLHNGTKFAREWTIVYGGLNEIFGAALAMDNAHLLAGRPGASPGAADLFDPGTGSLITNFTSPAEDDGFGNTAALLGDLAFVGAPRGATVYIYRRDSANHWNAAGTLTSPGVDSEFGAAIAGDVAFVSAPTLRYNNTRIGLVARHERAQDNT